MSDTVVVFVTDERYLPHYKALAVNCRREGKYVGDFLAIVPNGTKQEIVEDMAQRGFATMLVPDQGFMAKFNVFHPRLKEWKQALYLDADVIVQRPLQLLFDQLSAATLELWVDTDIRAQAPTEVMCEQFGSPIKETNKRKLIIADKEEVPVFMGWQVWDKDWKAHEPIYESMRSRFPHVFCTDKMWNTAILLFEPSSLLDDTTEKLRGLQGEFFLCNDPAKGGTDEPIIDLLLHHNMQKVAEKGWCFWGLDEENARVPSVGRGWVGGEIPVALHFGRWYAPWIDKPPDTHAYFNERLGVVCHDFYRRNLNDFDTVFPRG